MDIEVKHYLHVVKCPKCDAPIHLHVGKFVGGCNDKGGVIIQCQKCYHIFPCKMANPNDASRVGKNGRALDTWTDDFPHYLAEKYALESKIVDDIPINLVVGHEAPPAVPWAALVQTCYKWGDTNLENEAWAALQVYKREINKSYGHFLHAYVKSMVFADKSFVIIEYGPPEKRSRATFAKRVQSENDLNFDNLYMIDHSDANLEYQIDGIYTRNQLLIYLERLLNRWRYTACEILLVVPFIGFNYKNAQEALYQLWNWLEINIDEEKTRLVTRKGTFNLYKEAQNQSGIDFEVLVELGLLEPFIEKMASKEAEFFQKSHAKYYVGVYDDHVEVLSGSFNIHEGSYYENMVFKKYDKEFFKERYLHMFPGFGYKDDENDCSDESVHFMTFGFTKSDNWVTDLSTVMSLGKMSG